MTTTRPRVHGEADRPSSIDLDLAERAGWHSIHDGLPMALQIDHSGLRDLTRRELATAGHVDQSAVRRHVDELHARHAHASRADDPAPEQRDVRLPKEEDRELATAALTASHPLDGWSVALQIDRPSLRTEVLEQLARRAAPYNEGRYIAKSLDPARRDAMLQCFAGRAGPYVGPEIAARINNDLARNRTLAEQTRGAGRHRGAEIAALIDDDTMRRQALEEIHHWYPPRPGAG